MATTRRNTRRKQVYEFTLILDGVSRITQKVEDALFEAGCDDALLGSCDGIVSLDFGRESDSCRNAILSAIENVERAGIGARVERIEPIDEDYGDTIPAFNAVLKLRRLVPDPAEAMELIEASRPLWN